MSETNLYCYDECVFLANEKHYLFLKKEINGYHYEMFAAEHHQKLSEGDVSFADILRCVNTGCDRSYIEAARRIACERESISIDTIARVAVSSLREYPEFRRNHRDLCEEDSTYIRFIDPCYNEQFRIPDFAAVVLIHADGTRNIACCRHVDDYHLYLAGDPLHICQLAEMMERNGARIIPEPISYESEGAWKIGLRHYLYVQECDEGWDYAFYNDDYRLVDGGVLNDTESMLNEARELILPFFFGDRHESMWRTPVDIDVLMERVAESENN